MANKCKCGNEIPEGLEECDACKRTFWDNVKKAESLLKAGAGVLTAVAGAGVAVLSLISKFRKNT